MKNGIELKTGEVIPLDVIIFGTGYSLVRSFISQIILIIGYIKYTNYQEPAEMNIRGSHGGTMHEYFASKGGATAYLGSCVPGFPNLYILLGK